MSKMYSFEERLEYFTKWIHEDTKQYSLALKKKTYQKNRPKILAKGKKWRAENPEKQREMVRQSLAKNPNYYKKWYQKNRPRLIQKMRERNLIDRSPKHCSSCGLQVGPYKKHMDQHRLEFHSY